jgi:hypothetical protein
MGDNAWLLATIFACCCEISGALVQLNAVDCASISACDHPLSAYPEA